MALPNFISPPTVGQQQTINGTTYEWDGTKWFVIQATRAVAHNATTNRNAAGAHDDIYIRTVTLAEAIAEDAPVGTRYTITDLDNARYDVVESGDVGGFYKEGLSSGRRLKLIADAGSVVSLRSFGCIGDKVTDDTVNFNAALNSGYKLTGGGLGFSITNATFDGNLHIENAEIVSIGAGAAIRNNRVAKSSPTINVSLSVGQVSMTLPAATVGDIVLLRSSVVRYANVDGDYKYGQLVKVVSKSGDDINFYPAIAESFTCNICNIYDGYELYLNKVTFNASGNANNNTMFVADFMANPIINDVKLIGGSNQNIGLIVTGVGVRVKDPVVENFSEASLGYALGFNGSDIVISNPCCAKGRHVIEGNTDRSYLTVGFKVQGGSVTKSSTASIFTYVIGAHCNALNPIYENINVGGAGFLIGIRGGNGKVIGCELNMVSNSNYSPVLITERGIDDIEITDNTYGEGDGYLVYVSCNEDSENLTFKGNVSKGRKALIKLPVSLEIKNLKVVSNEGVLKQVFDFGLNGASILDFLYTDNTYKTIAPFNNVYFFDIDGAANFRADIVLSKTDDNQNTGFMRIGNITGDLSINIENCSNERTFKAIEVNSPTIGSISRFNVNNTAFKGRVNLSFNGSQVFSTIVNYTNNDLKSTDATAFGAADTAPIRYSGNTFNVATNVTLRGTYQPTTGNANIGSGNIVYNGQNVNFDGSLT